MSTRIDKNQHAILCTLKQSESPNSVSQLANATGLDQTVVSATLEMAETRGWVGIETEEKLQAVLGEGQPAELPPLPERLILPILANAGGAMEMPQVAAWARDQGTSMGDIVKWGARRGWTEKAGKQLTLTDAGRSAIDHPAADELAIHLLGQEGRTFIEDTDLAEMLKGRELGGHKIKIKQRRIRWASLTDAGRAMLETDVKIQEDRSQLAAEDLASGAWRDIALRPYDVTLAAETRHPCKAHPLVRILQETRQAFLRMGFSEIVSPHVESAFWNFDALFQPQDHPARDMQDTFYLSRPETTRLPDEALVARVRSTHQDGGDTGSDGWGYRWNADEAARAVARTHTTANTVREVAKDPKPPRKVFCVGRVFRNETISYKHLPEFTQVDGIIIDEKACFRYLLGTLAEFYRQMGFEKVKFKPAFFPYTEPSAEVFVWFEPKQAWLELGGAGVFRPEVTQPLGCNVPVLAWGLGLERLAMLRFNLGDIRELYRSDLDWLRGAPLCR